MELERAFDTLGLEPGASAQDIEAAYRRLCADFDARIGRVTSLALRDRYSAARAELEAARAAALPAAGQAIPRARRDDPRKRSWAVLGLPIGASPLEVASAYVSLCEELDRELASAPTEALRRRCLEARAEIDAAYQFCAAAPLGAESSRSRSSGYETQVAEATFEGPPAPPPPPVPPAPAGNALHATLRIDPDREPEPPRRRRKRPLRRLGLLTGILAIVAGGALGYGWRTDSQWIHWIKRYLPLPPAPELVEAQSAAEYLRRRIAEERRDIQQRAELTSQRVSQLQQSAATGQSDSEERDRAEDALEQAQARTAMARHLGELTERHIFSSGALAEAYGHMELGAELVAAGETDRAVAAYSEARSHLEATLASLDEAESAIGARSEALAARDAWVALASSAGLESGDAIQLGGERLEEADRLLDAGVFEKAGPELRRASHYFRTALDDGRRILAARRVELLEAERKAQADARVQQEAQARAAGQQVARNGEAAAIGSDVPRDRAEVKLVTIPEGPFLFGCNGSVDSKCPESEPPARRAEVAAFRIDRTEVRVSEYGHCVAAGACTPPAAATACNWDAPGRGDHPVNCLDWDQAVTYCGWVGKRLPTEQEWEKAARGTDGRTYPWGNEGASCNVAVMSVDAGSGCGASSTAPVGSRAQGRSPYGVFDMAGNVLEWTVSLHESGGGARVLRGGSWQNSAGSMRSAHREGARPSLRHESVGFRCAEGAVVADSGP